MKINLPEGYQMPDSTKPGEPFEAVATIQPGEGGFMLVALDGVEIPTTEMEEPEPEMEVEVGLDVADPEIVIPFGEG
jgi:hypothetical protein